MLCSWWAEVITSTQSCDEWAWSNDPSPDKGRKALAVDVDVDCSHNHCQASLVVVLHWDLCCV